MKWCSHCKRELSSASFYRNKRNADGLHDSCKDCRKHTDSQSHRVNRDRRIGAMREYRAKTIITRRQQELDYGKSEAGKQRNRRATARYHITHKTECEDRRIRKTYGITLAEYDEMLAEQHGVCKICGGVDPNGRRLAVDHDHVTGAVRGLLCVRCNLALGQYEKHPQEFERYLGEQV